MSEVTYKDNYLRCRHCDSSVSVNEELQQKPLSETNNAEFETYTYQCPACARETESISFKVE